MAAPAVQPVVPGQPQVPTAVPAGSPAPRGAVAKVPGAPVAAAPAAQPVAAPVAPPDPTAPQAAPQQPQPVPTQKSFQSPLAQGIGNAVKQAGSAAAFAGDVIGNASEQAGYLANKAGNAALKYATGVDFTDQPAETEKPTQAPVANAAEAAMAQRAAGSAELAKQFAAQQQADAKQLFAENPNLTKEQFDKMRPDAPGGSWDMYQANQQAAFPNAASIALAQFNGLPIPDAVKNSETYGEAQTISNDANAAIANPELAADLGVVPGTEKFSVATAFDPTFPARQQEAARQSAAKTVINGPADKKEESPGLDSTATLYNGQKVDFSSNDFIKELMKDKKHISDTLEALTKESEETKKTLDGYMKSAAEVKMERQQIENQIKNEKNIAFRELAGSGASQSSIDALAAWRTQALEPAYQSALIKEQNANAIYLGQKELMQQDWDRKLKATDTYEKLANIDATIFSTTSNRDIQMGQLAVSRGQLALAQKKTLAPGERILDVSTGEEIGSQSSDMGNFDFGGGESVPAADLATRLVKGDPTKRYSAISAINAAGNNPKAQMDVLYSLAASKENDPDQVVESSSQMVKKMQNAIAAIRKNPEFFGIGSKYQDLLSAINSQDPKYAELKAAVQAVQAGITTGMFGSRDSGAQIGMTDQMANALKAPNADTALRIMGQVSQQVYNSAIGKLTSQGLSPRQADVLFRHHITSI